MADRGKRQRGATDVEGRWKEQGGEGTGGRYGKDGLEIQGGKYEIKSERNLTNEMGTVDLRIS